VLIKAGLSLEEETVWGDERVGHYTRWG